MAGAKVTSSGGRGLSYTAKLNISEAMKAAQSLKKELGSIGISTNGTAKAFDVKPLTEYQAGLLKIKQDALDLAKAKQEASRADKEASIAIQSALREESRLRREQVAAEKALKAEQSKRKPTQVSNSQAEIDAYKRATQGSVLYTSAINSQVVARARLNTQEAATAIASGTLNTGVNQNTSSTQKQTAATNQNVLSKKQLAQMLAEEKLRQADATKELKNNAREMLNAKGSLEQRRAALIRLTTVYDRLSKAERESAAGKRLESIIGGLTGQIKGLEEATGRAQRGVGSYADGIRAFFSSVKDNILTTLGPIALFTAAFAAAKAAFSQNVEISDNFADVRRTAKLSKEEVQDFGKELKNLNTRSSLEGLLDIGFIGGRLSVPKKDLSDFVKQVDELAVVLKKEFPGGAEAVAESLGKIVTIYKVTQKEGVSLGTALSKVGSNLLELAHSGPVTVKYLQDFTLGVAGTAASAKLSIPVISAYGAVLGESGQIASSSALSITRLVTGLTTKTGKYFAIAQLADSTLTIEKFTKIVNTDTKLALDLFFKGLKAGNPVATEFAARLGSVGITTGKVTNAVKILAENQDKLANRIEIGTKAFEEGTSVAHNFEIANDTLGASVDKLHNTVVNLTTDPNSAMAGFFKGIIDGSTYAIKAISDLDDALTKSQNQKDQELVNRNSKSGFFNGLLFGGTQQGIDPKELAAAKARIKANISKSLNDEIAGKGYATADILGANKSELEIRKLLTSEINKQKIAVDRLGKALAFVADPKNTEAQTAVVEKSINKLRVAARQQSAVVAGLRKKLPNGDTTIYGDGSLVNNEEDGNRTIQNIKKDIKDLTAANEKLGTQTAAFKINRDKLIALRKELRIANGGKDTEGIAAEKQADSALKAQRTLQAELDAAGAKGRRKTLSADEQELADKQAFYDALREKARLYNEAVDKFNKDPKNKTKKQRVDAGVLLPGEAAEKAATIDKQATEKLKVTLDEQKKLYDDYEAYKEKAGKDNADKRYADLLSGDESYLKKLQRKRDELTNPQKSKGGSEVDTAGNSLQIKLLDDQIEEEKRAQQRKYDDLFALLTSYNEKVKQANDKLEEDIKAAQDDQKNAGDEKTASRIKLLKEANDAFISGLSSDELMKSIDWTNLFSNLDELTEKELTKLLNAVNSKFNQLSKTLNPIDLATVRDKLQQAKDVLIKDNPFKQVGIAIKEVFNTGSGEAKKSTAQIKIDWTNLAKATEGSFAFVNNAIQSADFLKEALGDIAGTAIASLTTIATVSIATAAAIKTAERASVILAIVQAALVVIQAVAGVFKSIFNKHDKDIDKSIGKHKDQVKQLGRAYNQLERDIKNSVGKAIVEAQLQQIENLKAQQAKLIKMRDEEASKKKADQDKIDDYNDQIAQIPDQITDIKNAMSEALTGTTAKSISDALIAGFKEGKRSAADFADSFKNLMEDALLKALQTNYLDGAIADFYKKFNDAATDGLTDQEIADLQSQYNNIINTGLDTVKLIDKVTGGLSSSSSTSSLNKNISQITSDQANALEGIMRGSYDLTKRISVSADLTNTLLIPVGKTLGDIYISSTANLAYQAEIATNTKNTVDELKNAVVELKAINKNTTGSSLRGAGLG